MFEHHYGGLTHQQWILCKRRLGLGLGILEMVDLITNTDPSVNDGNRTVQLCIKLNHTIADSIHLNTPQVLLKEAEDDLKCLLLDCIH